MPPLNSLLPQFQDMSKQSQNPQGNPKNSYQFVQKAPGHENSSGKQPQNTKQLRNTAKPTVKNDDGEEYYFVFNEDQEKRDKSQQESYKLSQQTPAKKKRGRPKKQKIQKQQQQQQQQRFKKRYKGRGRPPKIHSAQSSQNLQKYLIKSMSIEKKRRGRPPKQANKGPKISVKEKYSRQKQENLAVKNKTKAKTKWQVQQSDQDINESQKEQSKQTQENENSESQDCLNFVVLGICSGGKEILYNACDNNKIKQVNRQYLIEKHPMSLIYFYQRNLATINEVNNK